MESFTNIDRTKVLRDAVPGSHVENCCRTPIGILITVYHGYIIGDRNDEGQDCLIAS